MNTTCIDIINLIGLLISIIGSYIMFHFSPKVNTYTYLYNKAEMKSIEKKDAFKNNMVRTGMLLLLIGFLFQATAILINLTNK